MADLPQQIGVLAGRCEIGETRFDNADLSTSLKFGMMLFSRLNALADHYERMSGFYMPGDIRGPMQAHAAKDMKELIDRCIKDL